MFGKQKWNSAEKLEKQVKPLTILRDSGYIFHMYHPCCNQLLMGWLSFRSANNELQNVSSAAAVVTHRLRKASAKAAVSGLWYLNTVDMLCIGDLVVPCCSCPVIELETGFAADSGHSLTTGLSCGKESRAIWVLHGWLGGNKLEAGGSEPCTQHSHPTHSGLAESGPLYLDRETHTGQQIMWTLNCYCSNVW